MTFVSPAFVFPGQGSQKVGMGLSVFNKYDAAKMVWWAAENHLNFSLTRIAFKGPDEELKPTRIAQLALFVSSVAAFEVLKSKGIAPAVTAGHSIGEYAALVAAGALTLEEGLNLVRVRAGAMDECATANPGAMAAILDLPSDKLEQVLAEAAGAGTVGIANYNSPAQIVISGASEAVTEASRLATEAGAKRVVPLAVSGAFHSPLMQPAANKLADALSTATISDPTIPVYLNVTASRASGAEEIRALLAKQVVSQVRWHESMMAVVSQGVDAVIEVGSGKVLSGLAKRLVDAPAVYSTDDASDIAALEALLTQQEVAAG